MRRPEQAPGWGFMADSLQDQLRALGLAKSQPKKKRSQNRPGARRQANTSSSPKKGPNPELTLDEAYALRAREEKRQVERARRQKIEEDRRRRQLNQAIREIVSERRLNQDDADIARNFLFNGRIRKIYVTAGQNRALASGELGIVYLAGSYHLLEPDALEAVRHLSVAHVVELGGEGEADDSDHPVPDDLEW